MAGREPGWYRIKMRFPFLHGEEMIGQWTGQAWCLAPNIMTPNANDHAIEAVIAKVWPPGELDEATVGRAIKKACLEGQKAEREGDWLNCYARVARAALAAIGSGTQARELSLHPSRWRHRKRGTSYNVLTSTAGAECASGPINEGDHVTIYQGDDGNWWVRGTEEFQDGRFERVDLTEGWPGLGTQGRDAVIEEIAQLFAGVPKDDDWWLREDIVAEIRALASPEKVTAPPDGERPKEHQPKLSRADIAEIEQIMARDQMVPEMMPIKTTPQNATSPTPPAASDLKGERTPRQLAEDLLKRLDEPRWHPRVHAITRFIAIIRAEAERAEREVCMQIARDHHAPSVLRAIGDRSLAANCRAAEQFENVCDEPGCKAVASCGWPSPDGYRRTCFKHSMFAREQACDAG